MPNERIKNLITALADQLQLTSAEFMFENLEKEEDTGDILDLILSSNVSCLMNLMRNVSKEHPNIKLKVDTFITKLIQFLSEAHRIEIKIDKGN